MRNGLVSVVIPTRDRSWCLPEAIESVLAQSYKDVEIIVIDDGSRDDTRKVVSRYGGKLRYYYQENKGVVSARNRGLSEARGEYVAFLDDDDLWAPGMLERAVSAFRSSEGDTGVVYVGYRYLLRDGDKSRPLDRKVKCFSGDVFERLIMGNFIPLPSAVIKRECLEKAGGFDERIGWYEDWELFLRLSLHGYRFLFIDEPLLYIRIHGSNRSCDLLAMKEGALKVVRKIHDLSKGSPYEPLIRGVLTWRLLALGWYLTLEGRPSRGRDYIRSALPVNLRQRLQKSLILLLTWLPSPSIRGINLLAEWLLGQRDPYK